MSKVEWRDRCFEDFQVGDVCKHRNARQVTTYDNLLFTLMTQNPAPLHLNPDYVAAAGHAKTPLNSTLTFALVTGQSVADLTPNVMTNLGWQEVKLPAPAYEGDTIYSESVVESLRHSKQRPEVGIMTLRTLGYTGAGTVIIEFARTVMIYKKGCMPPMRRPEPIRKH